MISRLRRKFIIIAMLSVTAVLFILIASINIFNFNQVIRDADDVLNILTDNNGEFPADSMSEPKRHDPPGDRGNMRDGGRGKDIRHPAGGKA